MRRVVYLTWFGFTLGVMAWLAIQGCSNQGCTRSADYNGWTASVHADTCEDAQRRADAYVRDPNYEER